MDNKTLIEETEVIEDSTEVANLEALKEIEVVIRTMPSGHLERNKLLKTL